MVIFTSEITAGLVRFGRDEKQTDELMVGFIKEVTPNFLGASLRRHAASSEVAGWRVAAAR